MWFLYCWYDGCHCFFFVFFTTNVFHHETCTLLTLPTHARTLHLCPPAPPALPTCAHTLLVPALYPCPHSPPALTLSTRAHTLRPHSHSPPVPTLFAHAHTLHLCPHFPPSLTCSTYFQILHPCHIPHPRPHYASTSTLSTHAHSLYLCSHSPLTLNSWSDSISSHSTHTLTFSKRLTPLTALPFPLLIT